MFHWFKKASPTEQLEKRYKKLIEESYRLSHTNRKLSDLKAAEAAAILKEIDAMKK